MFACVEKDGATETDADRTLHEQCWLSQDVFAKPLRHGET